MRIAHVFETHLHNDYITGGYALAAATGAAYHVHAEDPVSFDRLPVSDSILLTNDRLFLLRTSQTQAPAAS